MNILRRAFVGTALLCAAILLIGATPAPFSGACSLDSGQATITCTSKTIIFWTGSTQAQNVTTYYTPGSATGQSGVASAATQAPTAGTFKNLYFRTNSAPASGQTFTATLMTGSTPGGQSASSVTCQITSSSTNNACTPDTSNTAAVTAGTFFSLQIAASATSGSTGINTASIELDTTYP